MQRIAPRLVPQIEILPWRRTQVLALQVHPSPSRPHYLTQEGSTGGVYVRVGSTNRRADSELIEELRRFAGTNKTRLLDRVAADPRYQNARKNSDRQNAKIEHDEALKRVMPGTSKV